MDCYDEYKMLITCACQYTVNKDHESVKETPEKKSEVVHSKAFLIYREHDDNKSWSITNTNCGNCLFFPFVKEFF